MFTSIPALLLTSVRTLLLTSIRMSMRMLILASIFVFGLLFGLHGR